MTKPIFLYLVHLHSIVAALLQLFVVAIFLYCVVERTCCSDQRRWRSDTFHLALSAHTRSARKEKKLFDEYSLHILWC